MGQAISNILLPIVTMDTTPFYRFYYKYIDQWIQIIPTPRRIMTVNWTELTEFVLSSTWSVIKSIPSYIWSFILTIKHVIGVCLRASIYPIFFIVPLILLYHVFISATSSSISPRQIKEHQQQHWLLSESHNYAHPLRAYAEATSAV